MAYKFLEPVLLLISALGKLCCSGANKHLWAAYKSELRTATPVVKTSSFRELQLLYWIDPQTACWCLNGSICLHIYYTLYIKFLSGDCEKQLQRRRGSAMDESLAMNVQTRP